MTVNLQTGGSERQFAALARTLSRDSFRLELGCLKRVGHFLDGLDDIAEFSLGGSFFTRQAQRARLALARHLRAREVAVAHSFDFYSNLMLIPVARLAEVPVVVGSQRQLGDLLSPLQNAAMNVTLQWCDRVVCNSSAAAERLRNQGLSEHKLVVIPNGLPEEAFAECSPALPQLPGVLRVGMIGRMNNPVKNHAGFLRAAARLAHQFPGAEFLLVGDGPLRPELERIAHSLGIGHRVKFLGERHDTTAVLAAMDISVVPSHSESLSNVILESMAAAKPVVATCVGGNPELVRHGETGLLVTPRDDESLVAALDFLVGQPALRTQWGQRARQLARTNFSLRRMSEQHEQLYASLLEEKSWRPHKRTSVSLAPGVSSPQVRVAMVAPSLRMIGGQAVQADLLARHWQEDPAISLQFIPINPEFPRWLTWVEKVPYLRTVLRTPLYLAALWRGTRDADILHIFSASYWSFLLAPAPAWLVARLRGKKTLINYRSAEAPDHLKHWRTALPVLRRADQLVVPSGYLADVFRGYGLQARIVPNFVDLSQFSYRPRQPLKPNLVCTRAFEAYYGVDLVVRAFVEVQKEFPEARLSLVGDGALRQEISKLVAELKVANVQFVGKVSRDNIGRFYDQADIFINASWLDNMPGSVLEAFASGTPVVSTAPAGIRYIVEHERTGLLCAPGDWRALAEHVIRLLRQPDLALRLALNAHKESERYRWEAVRAQWLEVYQSLYPGRHSESRDTEAVEHGSSAPMRSEHDHGTDASEREQLVLKPSDIICFANDWAADPLSKKQIMLRLARQHRVLWINSINNRRPRLARKDFRRTLQKLRDFGQGLTQVEERIWVLSPLYVPFHRRPLVRSLNRWLLRWQIRRALRQLHFGQPITWTFLPTSADVVRTLGEKLVVYQCVDEYSAFSDAAPEIRSLEEELLVKSDLVLVCSSALLEAKQRFNPRTHLVTHGVDYEHFRRASEDATPVAPELRDIPRPILGFHGLLADWVDLELIAELARKRPDWSIVLIGRVDTDLTPLRELHNVHLLGHRPYSRLPEYLRGFDVALLPFVCNELTRNANPLKLREYLAAGLPVVAAPLPEIARFSGLVSLASTADEYIREITTLLEQGLIGPSRHRSEKVAGESWDSKLAEIESLLAPALPDRDHLERQLKEHPLLRNWQLEFVRRLEGRHSQLIEYRARSNGKEATLVVKHITKFRTQADAEEVLQREYSALQDVRSRGPALEESLPAPLAILLEARAIAFNKLPGAPLSEILKREANRLTGGLHREEICQVAGQVGKWLRQFHETTRHPSIRYESRLYLAQLSDQLERCTSGGLERTAAQGIWKLAALTSRRLDGQPVAAAARQGDFIPQNILVDQDRISVVDFENFNEWDVIYEDLGAFVAYLAMLGGSPAYSKATLEAMARSFLSGYGDSISSEFLNLYIVKAAATVVAEFSPKKGVLGAGWLYLLRKHLLISSETFLGEVNPGP
jgi:glycosyltransferase involved in cell wall biosynthesis